MEIPIGAALTVMDGFILIFVRMTGLFVISPIFGRRNIPTYFKIGFSFFMALILINTVKVPSVVQYSNFLQFTLIITKEFLVGLIIGYASYLIFNAIYLAGQMIDMQVGFGMVNILDPISNIQIPITSNFYFIISMIVFLTVNGHHMLIRAMFDSYKFIPLGGAVFTSVLMNDLMIAFGNIFVLGFKISAPVIAAILVTDIALGVISKSVPQLNIFVVGMPLKIVLGIVVMIITIPVFIAFVDVLINGMNADMISFIKDMGPKQ